MSSQHAVGTDRQTVALKEVFQRFHSYFSLLLKNIRFLILVTLPFLIYFGYRHFSFQPKYEAEVKFLVEGSSSSFGGLGGLLGQFGIRNTGKANPYKIVEVAQSNYILEKILFDNSVKPNVAEQLIATYHLDEQWAKDEPKYANFKFKNQKFQSMDSLERVAFSRVIKKMNGGKNRIDPVLSFVYDEDTGVFNYEINSENETLALSIQSVAYANLKKFFEEDIIINSINTTNVLRAKADSIQQLITTKTYQLASIQDRTFGLVLATPGVKKMALEKEIQALSLAFAEVLKSYEISDVTLRDTKPMFLKLDESISPLESTTSSLLVSFIKAVLCGLVIGGGWLIGKDIYREIMA